MMIVSSPRPIDIRQARCEYQHNHQLEVRQQRIEYKRQYRLEMAIWSIVAVQVVEALILIAILVRR
jgi:hypothetical protein